VRRLRRFVALPAGDRRLLVRAALVVGAFRVGVRVVPFGVLRRLGARAAGGSGAEPRGPARWAPQAIAWAVAVASSHVPGADTCLVRALAARVLLVRAGHPACIRIGVSRGAGDRLQAHAWVESRGAIVIGESGRDRYVLLGTRAEGVL